MRKKSECVIIVIKLMNLIKTNGCEKREEKLCEKDNFNQRSILKEE